MLLAVPAGTAERILDGTGDRVACNRLPAAHSSPRQRWTFFSACAADAEVLGHQAAAPASRGRRQRRILSWIGVEGYIQESRGAGQMCTVTGSAIPVEHHRVAILNQLPNGGPT